VPIPSAPVVSVDPHTCRQIHRSVRRFTRWAADGAQNAAAVTIALSGPQGTGKTTLAAALGRALGAPVFSRDPLMRALSGHMRSRRVPAAGLRLQAALLAGQLMLGQSTVLECVAPLAIRAEWRAMSVRAGQRFVSIECVCSDRNVHEARVRQRRGVGWGYVLATTRRYRPDSDADFVADALRPLPRCVAGDQPPAFPEGRGPGRVALAAGGRLRVVGPEALPAGGTALAGRISDRRWACLRWVAGPGVSGIGTGRRAVLAAQDAVDDVQMRTLPTECFNTDMTGTGRAAHS
jgi:predicted kinase